MLHNILMNRILSPNVRKPLSYRVSQPSLLSDAFLSPWPLVSSRSAFPFLPNLAQRLAHSCFQGAFALSASLLVDTVTQWRPHLWLQA